MDDARRADKTSPTNEESRQTRQALTWLVGGLAALALIVGLVWLATGGDFDLSSDTVAGLDRTASLQLVSGGVPRDLDSEIEIGNGLIAAITLETTSDPYGRVMHVALKRPGDPDTLVTTSAIDAIGTMQLMDHGPVFATGAVTDAGDYQLPFRFDMAGDWQIDLRLDVEGRTTSLLLYLEVLD